MSTTNIIVAIVGIIVTLFGIGALLKPNIARWINVPGGPRMKAFVAIIVGIILIASGILVSFSN